MQKGNVLLVVLLILMAGVIVAVSFYMTRPQPQEPFLRQDKPEPVTLPLPPPLQKLTVADTLEQSFEKGLIWLMKRQLDNGAWENSARQPDVAYTAIALISVCEAPEKYQETYKDQIEKGIQYILDHIQDNGAIIDDPKKIPTYATYKTSLAIVALATQVATASREGLDKPARRSPGAGGDKYQEAIHKARDYLQGNQFGPESAEKDKGGWGYKEKGDTTENNANLSTTQFVMMALHYAEVPKEDETWQHAIEFLNKVQNSSETNKFRVTTNDGGFTYSPVESKAGEEELPDGTKVLKSYASMTYAGLLSFIYASVDKKDPRVQGTYNWIRQNYSLEENIGLRTAAKPNLGKQGLYYYYHTFAKALNAYGEATIVTIPDKVEHNWAKDLVEKLASLQKPKGYWVNEFEERWFEGYTGLTTPFSLMALNICRKWVAPVEKD